MSGKRDGCRITSNTYPAVSSSLLKESMVWRCDGDTSFLFANSGIFCKYFNILLTRFVGQTVLKQLELVTVRKTISDEYDGWCITSNPKLCSFYSFTKVVCDGRPHYSYLSTLVASAEKNDFQAVLKRLGQVVIRRTSGKYSGCCIISFLSLVVSTSTLELCVVWRCLDVRPLPSCSPIRVVFVTLL